jgi:hypothetical protein
MSELNEVQSEQLEEEIELRESILGSLRLRKATALTDKERGLIERSIDAVTAGDLTTIPLVRSVAKEIKKQKAAVAKANRVSAEKMNIDEIIETYNFQVSAAGGATWYYQPVKEDIYGNRKWVSVKKETLQNNFAATDVYIRSEPGLEDYSSFKDFNKKLVEKNRSFTRIIQSYTDEPGTLNLMNKGFCMPADDGSTDYHWIFDAIIETVSGGPEGCPETFEALQRTIMAKYLHPDNPYIPNPTIRDIHGRAGKGLLANQFLRRLFNGNIADNCNSDHVIGKFNSVIAGKAVVIVNETNRSKIDSERVKSFLGSPRILIEQKYEAPYYADNTCLVFFFTNDPSGGVNVSGTASDNRFSFFKVKQNLYRTCQRYFKEREDLDMTELEVKQWIEGTGLDNGQMLLGSEDQVGKWINAQIEKHGDITHIEPVHGEEHRAVVDKQRGAWTKTVEAVFTEPGFEYIRVALLVDLVREYNRGEMLPGRNKMRDEIQRLIDDRGLDIEMVQRGVIKIGIKDEIQRPIWRLKSVNSVVQKEDSYGDSDTQGRWVWKWKA